jgi:hypothetical protein
MYPFYRNFAELSRIETVVFCQTVPPIGFRLGQNRVKFGSWRLLCRNGIIAYRFIPSSGASQFYGGILKKSEEAG